MIFVWTSQTRGIQECPRLTLQNTGPAEGMSPSGHGAQPSVLTEVPVCPLAPLPTAIAPLSYACLDDPPLGNCSVLAGKMSEAPWVQWAKLGKLLWALDHKSGIRRKVARASVAVTWDKDEKKLGRAVQAFRLWGLCCSAQVLSKWWVTLGFTAWAIHFFL